MEKKYIKLFRPNFFGLLCVCILGLVESPVLFFILRRFGPNLIALVCREGMNVGKGSSFNCTCMRDSLASLTGPDMIISL